MEDSDNILKFIQKKTNLEINVEYKTLNSYKW